MKNVVDFEKVVLWVVILVRVGILTAIVWFGINEYKKWKHKQPEDEVKDNDNNP
ncbi:hypothetical protein KAH27_08085 [bacterium]|nr:hypothetical protein [bacterium]